MSDIRLPRLLGPDLTERARLHPDAASAMINMQPLSTASLTIPQGDAEVDIRCFAELFGPYGSIGIFRVAAVRTTYGDMRQLTLEHGIVTLEDDIVPDGTVLSGDMRAMLTTLLDAQTRKMWTIGDVEVAGDLDDVEAGMSNLLEAVLTIVEQDDTAMLAFDQSETPWKLHVRKKPTEPASECRLNRNAYGVNVTLDDTDLCTRVTFSGDDGAYHTIDADTIETWGVVHKAITTSEDEDPEEAARQYLSDHKDPAMSIEIEAVELAKQTGEPFDRFAIGTICRMALPEWGVAMNERIMSISYPDLYSQPKRAILTLSNTRKDASTSLATLQSVTRRNSIGVAQNLKYYKELDDRAVIMAKEIELRATKDELGKYLNEVWIQLNAHDASLELHAQHIDKVTHDVSQTGIRLDGMEADLLLWATRTEENGRLISDARVDIDGANATISLQASRINTLEDQAAAAEIRLDGVEATIDLKVSKDGLISAINLSPEQIRIASARVVLDGYVTISEMEAEFARIDRLLSGNAHIDFVDVGTGYFDYINCQGSMALGGTFMSWKDASVMTALPSLSTETFYMTYKDANGINQSVTVVTAVHFNRGELGTINYVGSQ